MRWIPIGRLADSRTGWFNDATSGGQTFHYTGAKQTFKVPRGVTTIAKSDGLVVISWK